ncbi:MAG: hypothetical protein O0X93_03070 [Methanocorpusculum sp.]|nr:hypothetical protein [Methanocorpusculum sp.]MDE2522129.1 hypothetical protein [Methanocorpusculum sp.]MDE2524324.1 hypothetical protein [Methanocorpusculum sp.]
MTLDSSGDSPNGKEGSTVSPSETSSRIKQIICPGCFEEMAKEELIGNKCPLCGYRLAPEDMDEEILETGDEELVWMLTQNLQRTLLTWLMDLGAAPLAAYRIASRICDQENIPAKSGKTTAFSFTARMTAEEKTAEKRCRVCGKTFTAGGRKIVSGDLFEPEPSVEYFCDDCRPQN